MERDSQIGGPRREAFPVTRHSVILAVRNADAAERQLAMGRIVEAYWRPAYHYVRLRWRASHEEAQDLVQGFFAADLEASWAARFDPQLATFRSWVRVCLDGYVSNQRKAARAQKRGGGTRLVSLDFESAQDDFASWEPAARENLDLHLERVWLHDLVRLALDRFRSRCESEGREEAWEFLRLRVLGSDRPPTYAELAAAFDVPETKVTNWLHWARQGVRASMLEVLRELTATDEEFEAECRAILGSPGDPGRG